MTRRLAGGVLLVIATAAAVFAGPRAGLPGRTVAAPAQPTEPFPTLPPTRPFPTLPPDIPTPSRYTPTPTLTASATHTATPTPTVTATMPGTPTPTAMRPDPSGRIIYVPHAAQSNSPGPPSALSGLRFWSGLARPGRPPGPGGGVP